ncbi:hypothetical protein [Rubritalea tangerina]|uniref:hypothetical protein n=1 Tax=Rubritalea tangerina TaxID=430798 RepID=UPI0036066887
MKNKYDEVVFIDLAFEHVVVTDATNQDLAKLDDVKNTWDLINEDTSTANMALNSVGLPKTIDGLTKLWTHVPLAYSFVSPKRNKKELIMAATRNLYFERGELCETKNSLFRVSGKVAVIYTETKDGITNYVYHNQLSEQDAAPNR